MSDSGPATALTYTDDAVGMTPGSSDWDAIFGYYPVLFNTEAEVGRLNPNNFAQFASGGSVDITSGSAGDVMIAFPRMGLSVTRTSTTINIKLTDNPNNPSFSYYAHQRGNTQKNIFYLGAYESYVASNQMRSLSAKTPTANISFENYLACGRGLGYGYDMAAMYQVYYVMTLFLLKYKTRDSQAAVGMGKTASVANSGALNNAGMNYGSTAGTYGVKLFGLENFWGNMWEFVAGVIKSGSRVLVATDNFNANGSGYIDAGAIGNVTGYTYIKDILGITAAPFIPTASTGNQTANNYYCDCGNVSVDSSIMPMRARGYYSWGAAANKNWPGIFMQGLDLSTADTSIASRLMYL